MLATQYFGNIDDENDDVEIKIHFTGLPVEYDHVLPTVDVTFEGKIHYNFAVDDGGFGNTKIMGTDIDAAILRLERECQAIKSFNGQIRTKEQREVAEAIGLRHTGKRIAITEDIDCYGMFYDKNNRICNLHCGQLKHCIHDMNKFRRKVERAFPQMFRTIFRLMKEYVEKNGG